MVSALEDDYEALVRLAVARVKELKGTLPLAQPSMADIDLDAIRAQGTVPEGANLSHEVVKIITEAIVAGAQAPDLAGALEIGYLAFGLVACTAGRQRGHRLVPQREEAGLHRNVAPDDDRGAFAAAQPCGLHLGPRWE